MSVTGFEGVTEVDPGNVTVARVEPSLAAGEVAAGAARGLAAVVATTTDLGGRVTDALRDGDVPDEVTEAARVAER